ncbi:hypothetical protein JNK13_03995, partial [bacterium]|nr:hypothetical protein [bacterium]
THSFGQGLTVTALQLARAYAALMNGGMLVAPKLLVKKSTPALRVFSPEASDVVRDILYGVTESEHGTAPAARIQGVRVSGKTGTAQKAAEGRRGYDPEAVLASFVGFVDTREIGAKRRLVMVVVVDEPNVRPRWGGTLAGPIFKRSIERILSNLVTNEPNLRTHSPRKTI